MFAISEAFHSIWRHRFVTILSVVTIAGALFVLGFFLTIASNLHGVLSNVQEKIAVELFLEDNTTKVRVASLIDEISQLDGVNEVEFITKSEAMNRFAKQFGSRYLVGLTDNPFPPSILVKLKPGTKLAETANAVAEKYRGQKYITQIAVPGEIAKKLSNALKISLLLSIIWTIILIFGAIIIIVNTIKLTIYGRRDTISIMQLVGATDTFIHRPFTIEGSVQGLLAGALSAIVLYFALLGMKAILPALRMPTSIILYGLVIIGIIFGIFGSRLAVRRFL